MEREGESAREGAIHLVIGQPQRVWSKNYPFNKLRMHIRNSCRGVQVV